MNSTKAKVVLVNYIPGGLVDIVAAVVDGSSGTQERIISFCWQNIRDALEGRGPRNVVTQIQG